MVTYPVREEPLCTTNSERTAPLHMDMDRASHEAIHSTLSPLGLQQDATPADMKAGFLAVYMLGVDIEVIVTHHVSILEAPARSCKLTLLTIARQFYYVSCYSFSAALRRSFGATALGPSSN